MDSTVANLIGVIVLLSYVMVTSTAFICYIVADIIVTRVTSEHAKTVHLLTKELKRGG